MSDQQGLFSRRQAVLAPLVAGIGAAAAVPTLAAAQTGAEPMPLPPYDLDPSRWGTAKVASFFPGFQHFDMQTSGAVIRLRHGGSGPPLLLLHGNPETHVAWHKIAARLAQHYHVVLPDLRGYGDSSLPDPGPDHINYSFRAMAQDMVEVMAKLGHDRFYLAGVDRGGRTSHRLCLDHPDKVIKATLMDVLPNHFVWNNPDKDWVVRTWHWGFMAQPEPFPERLISAVPAEYFLKSRMAIRGQTGVAFFDPDAMGEYIRCYTLKTITGSCRDYRATATSDFVMDTADKDKKLEMPVQIVWGARGQPDSRKNEFIQVWNRYASNIVHAEGFDCGHYIAEEKPDLLYDAFVKFFV